MLFALSRKKVDNFNFFYKIIQNNYIYNKNRYVLNRNSPILNFDDKKL